MSVINFKPHDRFGNQCVAYCYARAYAEKHGCELRTSPWVGQKIFEISDPPIERELPQRYDMDLEQWNGETDIELTGWGLHQKCLLYTRAQAKEWFRFQPWVEDATARIPRHDIAAHLRHGDFVVMDKYVAISQISYIKACRQFALEPSKLTFVSEEHPSAIPALKEIGAGFLGDFVRLMRAKILFRAPSTFSWFAAVIGDSHRVFSPVLDGIEPRAGALQDVSFVEGNWPALSKKHSNNSDLRLEP